MRKVGQTSEFPFGIYWWTRKSQKNQTFEKMKKFAGDIIILHMCTKNHNHMRYSSWDTKWDRIFCHFGPFFALLTTFPLTTQKKKVLKKLKTKWKCHHFKLVQQKKNDHMMYAYSDMECSHRQFFVISDYFLLFCPTIDPKN